jgi:hypothetical protein
MTTTFGFKDIIDIPQWRPQSQLNGAVAAGACFGFGLRNDPTNHPFSFLLRSATVLEAYDPTTDGWLPLPSPALAGTFGAGAACVLNPSQGPRGTLAAGATTTSIVLSTALPAAVAANQLANRGDGVGFKIRIIGNAAGSSGKIEERTIVGNTAGTTPTIYLDSALTFTPATGDAYEMLSGRLYMLGAGTPASGIWKYYDVATNSISAALGYTNLPATIGTDSALLALSEQFVPHDKTPGSGFFGNITASASASTSITGSSVPSLFADEYRNFQVRIVEDTTTPTAVGQRRRITTHTSGVSPVFTVAAWTVTPSSNAKFVVENDDDKILLRSSGSANTYTYNITAGTWDTSTFGASGAAMGTGHIMVQPFGVTRDTNGAFRHSKILCVRGNASAAIDELDIAAAATGTWTNDIAYGNKAQTFTTGTCGAYDPVTLGGRFLHLSVNGGQIFMRFDCRNKTLDASTYLRYPQGTAHVGGRLMLNYFFDGSAKLAFLYMATTAATQVFSMAIQR